MTNLSTGVPTNVWSRALHMGLHNDCIVSGEPCTRCENTLMEAFEHAYGTGTLDEVIGAMVRDYALDLARERDA